MSARSRKRHGGRRANRGTPGLSRRSRLALRALCRRMAADTRALTAEIVAALAAPVDTHALAEAMIDRAARERQGERYATEIAALRARGLTVTAERVEAERGEWAGGGDRP